MKEIALLWEYQELDMAADKLEQELKSSEERKKALYYKNVFYKAQEEMKAIEDGTDALTAEIAKIEAEIERLNGEFSFEIETEEDLELAKKCAGELSGKINRLSKALSALAQKAQSMDAKMTELTQKAAKAKKEYNESKKLYEAKSAEATPAIQTARAKRDEFGKKISKVMLEKYNKLKSNKGMPVSLLKDSKCMGCNMSLPSAITSKVKEGSVIVECENCGSILYAK